MQKSRPASAREAPRSKPHGADPACAGSGYIRLAGLSTEVESRRLNLRRHAPNWRGRYGSQPLQSRLSHLGDARLVIQEAVRDQGVDLQGAVEQAKEERLQVVDAGRGRREG